MPTRKFFTRDATRGLTGGTIFLCLIFVLVFAGNSYAAAAPKTRKPSAAIHLNFIDTGNPKGPIVIFIHAFPLNQAMWNEQLEFLKKTARVITFDIRGLGKSESDFPYTLEFIVDDLI